MPMPVVAKQCNDLLFPTDQRMITNDFTTRLYVSPPSVDSDCDEIFTVIVYDKNDNVNGHHEVITAVSPSTIDLTDKSEMASSSYSGQIPMYRLGSISNHPDSLTAYGHFAHIVPSLLEWVTGKSQFYTLAKDCYIEFYADQDGIDPDLIKVDGIILSNYDYTFNHMSYYKKKYGHFILALPGYGLHTLENGGSYVLYVICKNVNGPNDAAGYLTGYNQRKQ
uniref:IgGFc_binding domain-containing protein n=1 Tax=Rhabditophanes sp. KR3021 TaxID=114890 RepID=A0AC35TKC4_9BILA